LGQRVIRGRTLGKGLDEFAGAAADRRRHACSLGHTLVTGARAQHQSDVPLRQRDWQVIADDRDVHHRREKVTLGAEGGIDGLHRDACGLGDVPHVGVGPPELAEESGSRLKDHSAGLRGLQAAPRRVIAASRFRGHAIILERT